MSRIYNTPWYGNVGKINTATSKRLKAFKDYRLFQNYFTWLLNIAKKEFDTQGLPDTMDAKFIEDSFLWRGKIAAFDLYGKPFSMEANPYDTLTIFRRPAKGQCITGDGQNYEAEFYWDYLENKETSNAVLGYDNEEEYPFVNYIIDYAEQLADAMSSIRTAIKLSKLSGIIEIPEEQKNAVLAMLEDYNNNTPFIVITTKKGGMPIDVDVLNFASDSGKIKDLWDNYYNIKAEALAMFGISMNNNNDKKERMTQIEVVGNESIPKITEEARLKERKLFYDLVNEKWGTNITIKSNYNQEEDAKNSELLKESEGVDNGKEQDI